MREINGYWVDDNNNGWDCRLYDISQAERFSKTLINCYGCANCNDCTNCEYCDSCYSCLWCKNCKYCNNCYNCYGYTSNPQRIVSGRIGSRKAQTTIYYDGITTQVVCGCFCGNIDEFENKVKRTHKNNEQYLNEYLDFIGRCRKFWELDETIEFCDDYRLINNEV